MAAGVNPATLVYEDKPGSKLDWLIDWIELKDTILRETTFILTPTNFYTVKLWLSGLLWIRLNVPDDREIPIIEIWIIMSQEANESSLSNRANLNQSKLSKMHFVSYSVCELVTHSGLCFEVKQTQFAAEFYHINWHKTHSWKTGTRVASLDNQLVPLCI